MIYIFCFLLFKILFVKELLDIHKFRLFSTLTYLFRVFQINYLWRKIFSKSQIRNNHNLDTFPSVQKIPGKSSLIIHSMKNKD